MYDRDRHQERKTSAGLPIGVMLLTMAAIIAYLLAGGASLRGIAPNGSVYLPRAECQTKLIATNC